MRRIPVADLRFDMIVKKQPFLLRESNVSTTRSGSSLLHLKLADRTGSIAGVFFDVPRYVVDSLDPGRGVEVTGRVGEFKGQPQINVERIVPVELQDLETFLPSARRPIPEMWAEFEALRASISDPHLSQLLEILFDGQTCKAFQEAPAAKVLHHACVGGLLEHTLCVAGLVLHATEFYPEMNRDLALTLALLHDLGKIDAYDAVTFDLTDQGRLWSHLYVSTSRVHQAIDSIPDFDPELRLRVIHGILAHHGRRENGSPVVPMTLEALVVHHADDLDATARGAIDQFERGDDEGDAFTERSFMHDTRLFRGRVEGNGGKA